VNPGGRLVVAATAAAALVSCGGDDAADRAPVAVGPFEATTDRAEGSSARAEIQRHPDVIGATATPTGAGWTISATLSSPYDSPDRYADAWRVLGPDGTVIAVRELLHDHADEQPFTRSLTGVEIPGGVAAVTIEGRDQQHGWGGTTVTIELDRHP